MSLNIEKMSVEEFAVLSKKVKQTINSNKKAVQTKKAGELQQVIASALVNNGYNPQTIAKSLFSEIFTLMKKRNNIIPMDCVEAVLSEEDPDEREKKREEKEESDRETDALIYTPPGANTPAPHFSDDDDTPSDKNSPPRSRSPSISSSPDDESEEKEEEREETDSDEGDIPASSIDFDKNKQMSVSLTREDRQLLESHVYYDKDEDLFFNEDEYFALQNSRMVVQVKAMFSSEEFDKEYCKTLIDRIVNAAQAYKHHNAWLLQRQEFYSESNQNLKQRLKVRLLCFIINLYSLSQ